jgi:RecG-like helicase
VFSIFYFKEEIMQKKEQSSRQIVMCHLMTIMGIDVDRATQLVTEMEKLGLIQFDELGNVGILVLEGLS